LIFSYMQIKRYKYCIRVKQSIKVVFRYRQKGKKRVVFDEKFNKTLTIGLNFYGSSPVCRFEARLVGELLTNAENQYIKHIMNQYMYKQTIK